MENDEKNKNSTEKLPVYLKQKATKKRIKNKIEKLMESRSKGTKCDICDKRIYFFQKSSIIKVLNDETITIHKKCRFF